MLKRFFSAALGILFLTGCIPVTANIPKLPYGQPPAEINESNLIEISYMITDNLLTNLTEELDPEQIILVASFSDIKNLERSSNFGRVLAECITSRFVQKGYAMVEMKLRNTLYIKEKAGEFLLSRQIRDITDAHKAQAVVVGTYALAGNDVYISSRIVEASQSRIISAWNFKLPLSDNLKAMFALQ